MSFEELSNEILDHIIELAYPCSQLDRSFQIVKLCLSTRLRDLVQSHMFKSIMLRDGKQLGSLMWALSQPGLAQYAQFTSRLVLGSDLSIEDPFHAENLRKTLETFTNLQTVFVNGFQTECSSLSAAITCLARIPKVQQMAFCQAGGFQQEVAFWQPFQDPDLFVGLTTLTLVNIYYSKSPTCPHAPNLPKNLVNLRLSQCQFSIASLCHMLGSTNLRQLSIENTTMFPGTSDIPSPIWMLESLESLEELDVDESGLFFFLIFWAPYIHKLSIPSQEFICASEDTAQGEQLASYYVEAILKLENLEILNLATTGVLSDPKVVLSGLGSLVVQLLGRRRGQESIQAKGEEEYCMPNLQKVYMPRLNSAELEKTIADISDERKINIIYGADV